MLGMRCVVGEGGVVIDVDRHQKMKNVEMFDLVILYLDFLYFGFL